LTTFATRLTATSLSLRLSSAERIFATLDLNTN
jgi:hypothetical protein